MYDGLEEKVPSLLSRLRELLNEDPLTRDIRWKRKAGYLFGDRGRWIEFNDEDGPGTGRMLEIMAGSGALTSEHNDGDTARYRLNESFYDWLMTGSCDVILDDEERRAVRWFAERYLSRKEDIEYDEFNQKLKLSPLENINVRDRLIKQGLIENGIGDGDVRVLSKCVKLVRQWDNPPPEPMPDCRDTIPVEVSESLKRFRKDHPDPSKVAFVMMRFGTTSAHASIVEGIQQALQPLGIAAVRADDREYHPDLWLNVLTYIHGCGFGIAVFERLEADEFNPNVSLEVGHLYGLGKPVCLLKDKTLRTLHTDLVGKLYRPFDPQDPKKTIPAELSKWLKDKGIAK